MRLVAAALLGLALAAPAAALRAPDAAPAEALDGATVIVPEGLAPRESPARLAVRLLRDYPAGTRLAWMQLYASGEQLCDDHEQLACYPASLGRLWYVRLLSRTPARVAPPDVQAVPEKATTLVVADGGRVVLKR